LESLPRCKAGSRIRAIAPLTPLLEPTAPIGRVAATALGFSCKPVRAILFDKSAEVNWSLGWHQDRTICVRRRVDVEGFGPWTTKDGLQHVAPPFSVLANMVTLRVHLDDVPESNAPLLIAPGSHKLGLVPIDETKAVVSRLGSRACLAESGDVWLYSTPILHASGRASSPLRRRVLQVDYAAQTLPGGLEWLGV
jgi:ectoine hydroxylase-related dioxygenase (phytanoyl-CoA dioxygenase family)